MGDEKDKMKALPIGFYGDPAECVDLTRTLRAQAKRAADRERQHKSRRIRALVKEVMKNGGGRHGKR